jgi:hypothetical protein
MYWKCLAFSIAACLLVLFDYFINRTKLDIPTVDKPCLAAEAMGMDETTKLQYSAVRYGSYNGSLLAVKVTDRCTIQGFKSLTNAVSIAENPRHS